MSKSSYRWKGLVLFWAICVPDIMYADDVTLISHSAAGA
jgi:hypothetical protein